MERYTCPSPTEAEEVFRHFSSLVFAKVAFGDYVGAQRQALTWADWTSAMLRLRSTPVWKTFKRTLVARWFGSPERRVFAPGWKIEEVLSYAEQFKNRNVRVSSFLAGIACRAESIVLPRDSRKRWRTVANRLNHSTVIEVFPESSSSSSVCFRRFSTAFAEDVIYEAGFGQAMNIWEAQQGTHPFVSVTRNAVGTERWHRVIPRHAAASHLPGIETGLRKLILHHDKAFQSKWFCMCRRTGLDAFGVEGYFEPSSPEGVIVVDLDLPFDCAFMRSP